MKLFFVVESDETTVRADERNQRNLLGLTFLQVCNEKKESPVAGWARPLRLAALWALGLRSLQMLETSGNFVRVQLGSSKAWPVVDHAKIAKF